MSSDPITVVPSRLADLGGSGAPRTDFGLPTDLAERACKRLGQFALVMTAVSFMIMLLSRPVWQDHPNHEQLFVVRVMQIATVLLSAGLFLVARSKWLRRSTVLAIGLIYEVLFCFTVSLGYNWFTGSTYGVFASMTIATVVIAIYPMIIPSAPHRTFLASFGAACTAPLAIFLIKQLGVADAGVPDYLGVAIYPMVCVGLAAFGSRIIHGLNADVARAQELGSYQLERRLGKGGMGEVWRARHRFLVRPAAIKLIRPDVAPGRSRDEEDRLLHRFEREAQATASLSSPHTVALYDFGRANDGSFYYVMELLQGVDLQRLVERYGAQPPERVINILLQVCHSLAEAHTGGLVHRDIKPANIVVCRYGRDVDFVKVLDFGLVSLAPDRQAGHAKLTADGVVGGTPAYMAPEMAQTPEVDGRADIYSLGCVGFFLLTGRMVFEGANAVQLMLAHVKEEPPAPSYLAETPVPAQLDRVILSCLAKQVEERPQSADELARSLEACPLAEPWTPERAQRWWGLHRPDLAGDADTLQVRARRGAVEG
jgi:serine/threonine-protein kinase